MADSIGGMQDQLNKLSAYCAKNLFGVNETKTKCMILGHNGYLNLKFNGKYIEKSKAINIYAIFFDLWAE